MSRRWHEYFLAEKFEDFWRKLLGESTVRVCVITALGFDPRCTTILKTLAQIAGPNQFGFLSLRLVESMGSAASAVDPIVELAAANASRIAEFPADQKVEAADLFLRDSDGYPCGGRMAVDVLSRVQAKLKEFDHIVVDVTGIPRSVFYPLTRYLIRLSDQGKIKNVHLAVTENAVLDANIESQEFGEADYMHTFRPAPNSRFVWVPVIGSREEERLRRIYEHFKADCEEICPIVPFPGPNLRLSDEVVVSSGPVLFDEFGVSPDNILLCDAMNPFDVYRKVSDLHEYYHERLEPMLGAMTVVLSPLASKGLSIGMLLAAEELVLPVCYVEAGTYRFGANQDMSQVQHLNRCWSAWLTGDAYR